MLADSIYIYNIGSNIQEKEKEKKKKVSKMVTKERKI